MVAAIQLKRYVTGAWIFGVIICKHGDQQKSCLVILFEVDEGSKVSLHDTILLFGLTICLRMERGW